MEAMGQMVRSAAVLILLAGTLWILRRRGFAGLRPRRAAARRMECLERLPLSPQHTLHLIRLGELELLVASSPGGCAVVKSLATEGKEARP